MDTPTTLADLRDLIADASSIQEIAVEWRKKKYKFRYRILSDAEMSEVNQMVDIPPPRLPDAKDGTPVYDDQNPDYRKKTRRAYRDRRASIFLASVQDFPVEGNNLQEKAEWLEKKLPQSVFNQIVSTIEADSLGEVKVFELASFTSSDPSDTPRS